MLNLKTIKKVVTHFGVFHADEVVAIALIIFFIKKFFNKEDIVISRVAHQTEMSELELYDIIIDIGREYDQVKKFDHHQYQGGMASAGLIWKAIKESYNLKGYEEIDSLVKLVDQNDTGEKPSGNFELPSLISRFNKDNIMTEEQNIAFNKAINFVIDMIESIDNEVEIKKEAEQIINSSKDLFNGIVLEMPKFNRLWSHFINGETMKNVEFVIWEDKEQNQWSVQTTPKSIGSFERVGRGLPQVEDMQKYDMKFIHSGEFFACSNSKTGLLKYLKEVVL